MRVPLIKELPRMPEILENGTLPADEPLWQYDVVNTCHFCGTKYKLVPGDTFRKMSERTPGGIRELTSTCPLCGAQVISTSRIPPLPAAQPTAPMGSARRRGDRRVIDPGDKNGSGRQ